MTVVPLYDNLSSSLNSTWDYLVSFADLVIAETTYQVAKVINNNNFHVLMAISLIGNGLSLFAVRRRMTTSTSCFYIANLAICDTLLIFITWITILSGLYHLNQTSWECKIISYLMNVAMFNSLWLVVLMTVERCIVVIWPLKISGWVNMKRGQDVVSILYILIAAFNSFYLVAIVSKLNSANTITCTLHESHMLFYKSIWSVLDVVFYAYVPQILIFILNIVIIIKLAKASKEQAEMRNAVTLEQSQGQVTAMLLMVSITLLGLTCPYTIFHLCIQNDVWNYRVSARSYARYLLVNTLLRGDIMQLFSCAEANSPNTSSRGRGTSFSSVAITLSTENP